MRPEEILNFLRAQPFQPFRLHMPDDSQFDILHPELAIVTTSTVAVGVSANGDPAEPAEHVVHCSLLHITRVELIEGPSQSSSK